MSVKEIQTAIVELPQEELANLWDWIEEFRSDQKNRQLAQDPDDLTANEAAEIRAGIGRGLEAAAAGRVKPLAQAVAEARQRHGFSATWASGIDGTI